MSERMSAGVTEAVSYPCAITTTGYWRWVVPKGNAQGVTMRTTRLLKIAAGTGAALLTLAVAPITTASAAPPTFVPCSSGAAGLIAAINAVNGSGGGTISLTSGCTYTLTTPDNGENGLPVVTTPISVFGNGATITGSGAVRIFEVDGPGGNLSLRNITLTGGSASDFGGAIFNSSGTVTLNQSVVTGNSAVTAGGGIASGTFGPSRASLTLNGSVVKNNSSPGTGMGDGNGGGIVNAQGNATLNFTRVSNNFAGGASGGGIASGNYMGSPGPTSKLTLNFSQVNNNTAPNAGGGGIQNLAGNVTLNVSQVNGNTSLNGGGIASGNGAGGGPGGPPPGTASLTVFFSQVNGNTSTAPIPPPGTGPPIAAGGIANGGNAVITGSEVENNTATTTSGAGIVNHGTMTLNFAQVNNNTAAGAGGTASGGGIVNANVGPITGAPVSGILTINFSQVNGNSAGGLGGGILNGLPNPKMPITGTLTISHSQVDGNSATLGGGGIYSVTGGVVSLTSTSVKANNPDNCEPISSIAGCTG